MFFLEIVDDDVVVMINNIGYIYHRGSSSSSRVEKKNLQQNRVRIRV